MLIKQQLFIEVDLMGLFGNCLDADVNILCFSTLARPGCNVHNFASRMECYRCNGPREAGICLRRYTTKISNFVSFLCVYSVKFACNDQSRKAH